MNGQSQTFSSTNELIQSAPAAGGPATVAYDNNGNETDDGTYLYTYDALNRLTSVTLKSSGLLIAVYSYDALGRRIQKVVTNSGSLDGTTDYYYDGSQDIEEHNGSGKLTQQYVYGGGPNQVLVMDRNLTGGPTATAPGDQRLFYYQNALGSVMALTDAAARILEAYQYDAYGRQTIFSPGTSGVVVFGSADVVTPGGLSLLGNPFLFTGQMLDGETGLYYYRSRFYNPAQGRFISRDPLGPPNASNALDIVNDGSWYSYVDNNPAGYVDPTGLQRNIVSGSLFGGKVWFQVLFPIEMPNAPGQCALITGRAGGGVSLFDVAGALLAGTTGGLGTAAWRLFFILEQVFRRYGGRADLQFYGYFEVNICLKNVCPVKLCADKCEVGIGARLLVAVPNIAGAFTASAWGGVEGGLDLCNGDLTLTLKGAISWQVNLWWGLRGGFAISLGSLPLLGPYKTGITPFSRYHCSNA